MQFPCTVCGICCQNISSVKELQEYDLGNGVCMHFDTATKMCKIYDDRPDICRVEKMFKKKYREYFTKEEFYIENAKICNSLQKQYGIDEYFRIKIAKD